MKRVFPFLVAMLVCIGCASRPPLPPASPEPRASASAAAGLTLKDLGLLNGPEKLSLPTQARVLDKVDQPNVVALYFSAPTFDVLAAHLRTALPQAGLTIQHDSPAALLFSGHVWEGSATVSGDVSAITLRRR